MSGRTPKILITGATGFVGRGILKCWDDCIALPPGTDLRDLAVVEECLVKLWDENEVVAVAHLAAQANPKRSYEDVRDTWSVNALGTVHLLETLSKLGFSGRFLYVSTGAAYSLEGETITEESATVPRSPYVASKLAGELAALEWGRRTEAQPIVVRPFNHSGPGQSEHYFLPSMVNQVLRLKPEGGEIEVGNIEVYRDFLHVADVVRAYRALLERGRPAEIYNLAGGTSLQLKEILATIARKSGRRVAFRVSLERFVEERVLPITVDLSKITADTGWTPRLDLERLISDLIESKA